MGASARKYDRGRIISYSSESISLFLDNVYMSSAVADMFQKAGQGSMFKHMDLNALFEVFAHKGILKRATVFGVEYTNGEDFRHQKTVKLVDYLSNHNWSTNFIRYTAGPQQHYGPSPSALVLQNLTIAAIKAIPYTDHYVIFTGDSSMAPLIQYLVDIGKRVTVAMRLSYGDKGEIPSPEICQIASNILPLELLFQENEKLIVKVDDARSKD